MTLYLGSKKVSPTKTITKEVSSMKPFFNAGGKCSNSTATSFEGIIQYSDTSNVTDMSNMFYSCSSLTSVPQLDTSNVTSMDSMFNVCSRLEEIHMINMKVDFDIHYSTKFTREALLEIINNCYDLTTLNRTATLTMGTTNLAKLTDEDKLIATNKGWTLA